jgi:predicted porin
MVKQLVVAAALSAALATGAARADVVLYGKIYAELATESFGAGNSAVTYSTLDDEQNLGRLGVKFSQELTSSLTAVGKYEFSVNAPDSSNDFNMRDAFVGLKGSFGQVAMGRFDGAYKVTGGVNWDPFAFTSLQLTNNGGQSGSNFGNAGFVDRAIEFRTPDIVEGGARFVGILQYGADASPSSTTTPKDSVLGGITVGVGGFELIYAFANDTGSSDTNQKMGVKFIAGDATFMIQSEEVEQGGFDPGGEGGYMTGIITYQVGNWLWVAEIADYNSDFVSDDNGTPLDPTDDTLSNATLLTLGFRYYMAKNIWINLGIRETDSDIDAQDSSATALGMRFDF